MTQFLYYPGFMIEEEDWLKFALLYFKNLNTIVPFEADEVLTPTHQMLLNETNLLEKYRPTYDEISKSTVDAVEKLEKIFAKPERFLPILGRLNVLDFFRNQAQQDFELFESKFSYEFGRFCLEQGVGHESGFGIKIHRQLGIIYMAILAHNIGDHNDISVITDLKEQKNLQHINNHTWRYNNKFNGVKAIKSLIELKLPTNLSQIPLSKIIAFRNQSSFQSKLDAFHQALSNFEKITDQPLTENNFYIIEDHLKYSKSDLASDFITFGSGLGVASLGLWIEGNQSLHSLGFIKELIGAGSVLGGSMQVYNKISGNNRRMAKRYLTDLNKLKVNSFT